MHYYFKTLVNEIINLSYKGLINGINLTNGEQTYQNIPYNDHLKQALHVGIQKRPKW